MDEENNIQKHVVFGAGPVGRGVTKELAKTGCKVVIVNRSGVPDPELEIYNTKADAMDADRVAEICGGAYAVYNCLNPPYNKWPELFPVLQNNLIDAAARANAKLISIENLYMYGKSNGKPLTEETPFNPNSRKGEVRARMAEELIIVHKEGKVRTSSLRASDFFGPEVMLSAMGERVFYPVINGGKAQVLGKVNFLHTQSYVPDVARGLVTLSQEEQALGQAWHVPSPETLSTKGFIEKAARMSGAEVSIQAAPRFLVKIMGWFNPIMREISEMLYSFEEEWVMDYSKYQNAFGNIATPLDKALEETIGWFKSHQPK